MPDRTLGRTGVQVSLLALGARNVGRVGRTAQDEATAIVDAARPESCRGAPARRPLPRMHVSLS
ncbi:aryl-alcohol dehydrogenase-like predicted oxidoreductase [Kitasatospora sp. MAA19]|nr:aryl-alcohol dehydrogenase-like predicted oxidoreductase [Kitasatospora sp. MAA19]